jgi:hypothetical protein
MNSSDSPKLELTFQIHNLLNLRHEVNQKAQFKVEGWNKKIQFLKKIKVKK